MEVVLDPYDPSGMFSKAGRASLEMYQLILQRDRILYNKKTNYHQKDLKPPTQKDSKTIISPDNLPIKEANEPFAKMISRGNSQKLIKNDKRFGMYHPRYNLIYKRSPLYVNEGDEERDGRKANEGIKDQKIKSPMKRNKKAVSCYIKNNAPTPIFLDIKPFKIKGPTPMKYQLGRNNFPLKSLNSDEKRFEELKLPEIYSNNHRIPGITLDVLGRSKSNFKRDDCATGLEYIPKYNLVWPKSAVKIPDFSKGLSRNYLQDNSFVQGSHEDSVFLSNSGRKIMKTPDFSKMLARKKSFNDENTVVSSYQKENSVLI